MIFIPVSITIACATAFAITFFLNKPLISFVLKALAGVAFLAVGLTAIALNKTLTPAALLMIGGGVFGLCGDLILHLREIMPDKETSVTLWGIIAFSLGHITYYIGLVLMAGFNFYPILFGIGATILITAASFLLKLNFGKLLPATISYTFLLTTMVGQSFFILISRGGDIFGWLCFIGFLAFLISDIILSTIYFRFKGNKTLSLPNHAFYYMAQILIMTALFAF